MSAKSAIFRQWKLGIQVTSLAVNRNGDWVVAALGDGSARIFSAHNHGEEPKEIKLHNGVCLSLQGDADAHAFLSGGDDGRVVIIDPALASTTELNAHANQWIDCVAGSADGKFRAYNTGKKIHVLNEEGSAKFAQPLEVPSTVGGIAFSPNSKRLAVSHYNGVSLFWLNAKDNAPIAYTWKGSHLDLIWTPDGKSLLTSMQENALHGWQIADGKEMRMQGYAGKVRSMAFTVKGKYLATSGADQIICWPFLAGGPWGKPPLTLGGADSRLVTQVAPHPKDEMVAAGYSDGMIVMAPLDGRVEIMIKMPVPGVNVSITGLVWNATGDALFAASESGDIMLFTIESVRNALVQH